MQISFLFFCTVHMYVTSPNIPLDVNKLTSAF
jgi:hypothetical protein